MEKDAVSAGVEPIGGLFNTADIRILICYILNTINEPVPADMLSNLLHYEGIANGFEVSDSIASLQKSGMISPVDESEDSYTVTAKGREVAETLKTSLSFTVRDRACTAALKMMTRFKNSRNTEINILHEDDRTYISCSAIDRDHPFITVKLLVADETQALCIKERFLDHSSEIYSEIIELLTKYEV